MKTIVFTVPDEYADQMSRSSNGFYLDVFGNVRDRETTDSIGQWQVTDLITWVDSHRG